MKDPKNHPYLVALFSWTFAAWHHTVILMFLFFSLLYWSSALGGRLLFTCLSRNGTIQPADNHAAYPGQQRREIMNSMRSVLVFALQGIILQQGIVHGYLHVNYHTSWACLPQMLILFFWNELHFFIVHRLLHLPFLARRIHWVHHRSKEPTVFSTFSFHWIEAFLLGTVILFPLAVYPFQIPAILFLPVMSIVLNTLGHCNYNLFPGKPATALYQFSVRHSLHHKKGKGNYGFMLPWLDRLAETLTLRNKPS